MERSRSEGKQSEAVERRREKSEREGKGIDKEAG